MNEIAAAEITAFAARNNLRLIETADIALLKAEVHRFEIADKRPLRVVLTALSADPLVLLAQPDYVYALTEDASSSAAPRSAGSKSANWSSAASP